jgi:hypothetical protein
MKAQTFVVLALAALPRLACATELTPSLSGLSFLVGEWSAGKGVVADTGGTSTGRSCFTVDADGALLLRRDHTDLFDRAGKPAGAFDQVMTIYNEGGKLRADYVDAQHVIHYDRVDITSGQSATFTSAVRQGAPVFRLVYRLSAPETLSIAFSIAPPSDTTFQPIATGTLTKAH